MYRCAHCLRELFATDGEVTPCVNHPYGNIEFIE